MFIIFGDKHRTEPVPDGLRITRDCPKCEQSTEFRERVVSKQFRVYFIEMFTHSTHHVLECSECGNTFVTDEVKDKAAHNDQSGTIFGHIQGAAAIGKQAIEDGTVSRTLEQAEAGLGKALGTAQEAVGGLLGGLLGGSSRSGDKERKD